jgi:hypothetical protein
MGSEREKTKNPVKKDTGNRLPGGGEYIKANYYRQ